MHFILYLTQVTNCTLSFDLTFWVPNYIAARAFSLLYFCWISSCCCGFINKLLHRLQLNETAAVHIAISALESLQVEPLINLLKDARACNSELLAASPDSSCNLLILPPLPPP